jgi:hypothetical protein
MLAPVGARGSDRVRIDDDVHNPRGFLRQPPRPARPGRLQFHDGTLVVSTSDAGRRVALAPAGIVDGSARTLRRLHHLDLTGALARPRAVRRPVATARLLATLCARGVPLVTGELPPEVRAMLHSDVVDILQSASAELLDDPLMREALAVRQRRAVFRRHVDRPLRTVSVLAATHRPYLVDRVAAVVGAQRHVDAELVLVTHGFALRRREIRRVRHLAGIPVTVREADADALLGDVLNLAVEAAGGQIVTKLDDDDHYGRHHLEDLVHSLAWSGATLVGAVDEFTHLAAPDLTLRHRRPPRQEITRRRVPGPTMTIRRADLVALGGWARVPAHVDRELNDTVHDAGGAAHCTHGLGFVRCRHGDRHTWSISDEQLLRSAVESWPGLRPPPELYVVADTQRLASLSSQRPTTRDMNSGCGWKPIEA